MYQPSFSQSNNEPHQIRIQFFIILMLSQMFHGYAFDPFHHNTMSRVIKWLRYIEPIIIQNLHKLVLLGSRQTGKIHPIRSLFIFQIITVILYCFERRSTQTMDL